jgi:hypothetical protein
LALSGRAETKARTNLSSMFDSRSQLSSSGLCPRHLTNQESSLKPSVTQVS